MSETLQDVARWLEIGLKAINLQDQYKIEVSPEDNWVTCDAFTISPTDVTITRKTILGDMSITLPGWDVSVETVIRGVYRTRNGDGWPDTVDYAEVGKYETAWKAVHAVLGHIVEDRINSAFEAEALSRADNVDEWGNNA